MTGMSSFRSIGFAPLGCAVLGGVLTLGTVVGQHGSAPQDPAASPMAGMDHSKMAGMAHSPTDQAAMAAMPGMAGSPAASATTMDMAAPGMAASMPGGFHASCASAATCTVMFARNASGVASVLGVHTRLKTLTTSSVRLVVDGRPVVLHRGTSVRSHGLTLKLAHLDAKTVSITFRKAA
jgi:hypothetical protein